MNKELDQLLRGPIQPQLLFIFVYYFLKNLQSGRRTHFIQVKAQHKVNLYYIVKWANT